MAEGFSHPDTHQLVVCKALVLGSSLAPTGLSTVFSLVVRGDERWGWVILD